MRREVGGMVKWEGTWVNLWLTHVDVWQKPMQYCKAIILQLKINKKYFRRKKKFKREKDMSSFVFLKRSFQILG